MAVGTSVVVVVLFVGGGGVVVALLLFCCFCFVDLAVVVALVAFVHASGKRCCCWRSCYSYCC